MPRSVSLAAMQGALAQETDEVYLILMEVDHTSFPSPLRFVNNSSDVTSGGDVYTAFPFEVVMPDNVEGKEPLAKVIISNVTRELIDEIRSISDSPIMTISVILDSSPNTIEWGPLEFQTSNVTYDADNITFTLGYNTFSTEPFPYIVFDSINFPGMFQ